VNAKLTGGQIFVLSAAAVPMVAVGIVGGIGTYANIAAELHRAETALGVVAAGEGVTLVLSLVMVGVTMLGQAAPAPVRIGLWITPLGAAAIGLSAADSRTEAAIYAMTPLAMSVAAEGLGFLARRIVIHRTGTDMEAQRRNANTVQRLAYHQARAAKHPDKRVKWWSERVSWRLARQVGRGDIALGGSLVEVQREKLTQGAGVALAGMFAAAPPVEPPAPAAPVRHSATEVLRRRFAEMDPADAIRIAHDAHPDTPPAELASLLITYGVIVDAVQVALVLGGTPERITLERDDTDDAPRDTPDDAYKAPQVTGRPALSKAQAIIDAAAVLGPHFKAADIVDRVKRINHITTDAPYVRAVLSREAKKAKPADAPRPMEGGFL